MSEKLAYTGARIFDGEAWHDNAALVVNDGVVEGLMAADSPSDAIRVGLDGGMLVPGLIDLQVNGGNGLLLNNAPHIEGLRTICASFPQFGTTACLPTLITDTPQINDAVIAAAVQAVEEGLPGFLGLHLEGPHLSIARKGAHDPALIREMNGADEERLLAARSKLPNMLITVAAETVRPEQVARLTAAGIIVSIGHSDASYTEVRVAADAGASMATHLFNAMSQLGNREPGVVGATLDIGTMHAGLIADGIHVDSATIGVALRAKRGPGRIFLVSDAMAVTGTDLTSFELNGRIVYRKDGALRLADGTLAGADLSMIAAVTFMHRSFGLELAEALRMAALYPAQALGIEATHGHLMRGARADMVHLSDDLGVRATYIGGRQAFSA